MRIPFRDSRSTNDGHWADKRRSSNLAYLELYMAVHNCKELMEDQVLELQGLLAEKLKNHRELQRFRSVAD